MNVWVIVLISAFAIPVLACHIYIIWLYFRCTECRGRLNRIPNKPAHGPMGIIANQCGWWKCQRCGKEQLRLADVGIS